jgi:hypothetical protein
MIWTAEADLDRSLAQQPVTFSDTSESDTSSSDDTEPRRDSQWKSPPAQTAKTADDETPTSCFGHFDRLDVEYTPKPTTKARVVVYHDGPIAAWSWSNTAVLRDTGIASQDFAARCGIDGMEGVVEEGGGEAVSQERAELAASSMQDVDADAGEEEPPTERQIESLKQELEVKLKEEEYAAMTTEQVELSAPLNMLTSLQVSDDAERVLLAEDLYFAGRLAATCVILQLDGMDRAAEVLGQWSVDLVGKRYWDKMVVSYGTAPRHENETGDWMAYLLGEVDINLRKFDEGKAKELRDFVGELQEFGIIPTRDAQDTQNEAAGGQ